MKEHPQKRPRRASKSRRSGKDRQGNRRNWCGRLEPLEKRFLLSVAPGIDKSLLWSPDDQFLPVGSYSEESPFVPCGTPGIFAGDSETQAAVFDFTFEGSPVLEDLGAGVIVGLDGEATWLSTGDPVVPVRESTILLPEGMRITSIEVSYLDAGVVLGNGVQLLAAPSAVPFAADLDDLRSGTTIVSTSFGEQDAVQYSNHTVFGYNVGTLSVFPIEYDTTTDTLIYHSEVSVHVNTAAAAEEGALGVRSSEADRVYVAELVDNPAALDDYIVPESTSGVSPLLPEGGPYEYVIITGSALESSFQPLVNQKISRGLTAGIVTTETIYANYSGTETGDGADRIRNFIADAYANWGTQWVLLGGDAEVVAQRGVYSRVGDTIENSLPTDMYFACLDGTWNGDGDGVWGESNDGAAGGDIDLMPEVYVGRAPVSSAAEAANFVAKTVRYETTAHPNAATAVWLGEQLDADTYGSYSGIPIRDQSLPDDWTVVERYDSAGGWNAADLIGELNASPHIVNHLGHANETYNARLYRSQVDALTNADPYFMYSQGCMSGSFDTHDVSIAEQHVVTEQGAFAVVMNSRYGWYIPGSTPGGSHYYAMEFWDAVFNEGLTHLGEANHDSKVDNLFRVGSTGAYRWIHFETNLLGDPETPFQIGDAPQGGTGEIHGTVWEDANGDGQRQAGELALPNQTVFLDLNGNGQLDLDSVVAACTDGPVSIPDNGSMTSTLVLSGGAPIGDLNVTLDISHTYDQDLVAYLIGPSGTRVELFSSVGGWGDNFTNTTLDDEAGVPIAQANAPFTGTFQPAGLLSRFDGEDPNGTWTLELADTMAWDFGTLNSWSLEVTPDEPYTQTAGDGSFAFTGLQNDLYSVRHVVPSGWAATFPVDGTRLVGIQQGEVEAGADFLVTQQPVLPPATDLGTVDFLVIAELNLTAGDHVYSLRTAHQGYLTVEALFEGMPEDLEMKLYDASFNELATSGVSDGGERIDRIATAGAEYYVSLAGSAAGVDLRLANLVWRDGSHLVVHGTAGNDRLDFAAADWHQVTINGVHYAFQATVVTSLEFDGGAGNDTAVLCCSTGEDTAAVSPGSANLSGANYQVEVTNTANVILIGAGGNDVAFLFDSAGDDVFCATPEYGELYGGGFYSRAQGFAAVHAVGRNGGYDVAHLYDSAGNDTFVGRATFGKLSGDGFYNRAKFFDAVHAYSKAGGHDVARLFDSAGDDTLVGRPDYAKLSGEGFYNRAKFFAEVYAYANAGGNDLAYLFDSGGNETFVAAPDEASLTGGTFDHHAVWFDNVSAFATSGGSDKAFLYDSSGDDVLVASPIETTLSGQGFEILAKRFDAVYAIARSGGHDQAYLYDSAGDDTFVGRPLYSKMQGDGFRNWVKFFDAVYAIARSGGHDQAFLFDSAGDDTFVGRPLYSKIYGDGFLNFAKFFDDVLAVANAGGNDETLLFDSEGNDFLEAADLWARISYDLATVEIRAFNRAKAVSNSGGNDTKQIQSIDFVLETPGLWFDV